MQPTLPKSDRLPEAAEEAAPNAAALLRVLIRNHFDVLLGPGSDFIPVMLYESRSITAKQRVSIAKLQSEYESVWEPVLQTLSQQGQIKSPVKLARLLIFGALNWSVKWFDVKKDASLDDLADAAMALFIQDNKA
ncbi:hypothetical protein LP416_18670 [Polaromonas sp. P2-4]|nr:hypothetical protein LP416_18670 [Polaromonas sp. P2-4]